MPATIHAFDYLALADTPQVPAVCAVFGDDAFLKRLALTKIRDQVFDSEGAEFSFSVFDGRTVALRDVMDELSTMTLFGGGRRVVLVESGDEFVSSHRAKLEDYVAAPRRGGVLILDVKTWPSSTRLYKAIAKSGLQIECKVPRNPKLVKWLTSWASVRHSVQLDHAGAELLVEMTGPEPGLLDQELAKLAATLGSGGEITSQLIHDLVGGWRTKTTWEMIDAIVAGDAPGAIAQLDQLLAAGEHPVALLGQVAWSLRPFAAATGLIEQAEACGRRVSLRRALELGGVKPFRIAQAESSLRRIGRRRAGQLYRWVLDVDLAIKGSSSSPTRARIELEKLICRLTGTDDARLKAR